MFDDVVGLTGSCAETFRSGVRDAFGASIIVDVIDPIRYQIDQLCILQEDVLRQSLNVEQLLQDARAMSFSKGGAR